MSSVGSKVEDGSEIESPLEIGESVGDAGHILLAVSELDHHLFLGCDQLPQIHGDASDGLGASVEGGFDRIPVAEGPSRLAEEDHQPGRGRGRLEIASLHSGRQGSEHGGLDPDLEWIAGLGQRGRIRSLAEAPNHHEKPKEGS